MGFRNLGEGLCASWALPLVECVAVWALKLPVVSAPLRSLHSRSPPDFLQLIPTHSKPTCHKALLLDYGNRRNCQLFDAKAYRINLSLIITTSYLIHFQSSPWRTFCFTRIVNMRNSKKCLISYLGYLRWYYQFQIC